MADNPFAQFATAAKNPFAAFAQPEPHYADVPYTTESAVPLTRERPLSDLSAREMIMGAIETPVAIGATVAGAFPVALASSLKQNKVAEALRYQPRSELAQRAVQGMGEAFEAAKIPPYMPVIGPAAGARAAAGEAGIARAARQGRIAEQLSEQA